MNVYSKLLDIQMELKAPKNQFNKFGGYNYRNCEDILESLKPLLQKYKATLFISDSLEFIGDRYYIKAIATFTDIETSESLNVTAFAREEETKKGQDQSQITGASSSYARKYALNGLFAIDDNKDSDYTNQTSKIAQGNNKQATGNISNTNSNNEKSKCSRCGEVIEPAVANFSQRAYGKLLCRKCQAIEKRK